MDSIQRNHSDQIEPFSYVFGVQKRSVLVLVSCRHFNSHKLSILQDREVAITTCTHCPKDLAAALEQIAGHN